MRTEEKLGELLKLTLAVERFGPVERHLTEKQLRELDDRCRRLSQTKKEEEGSTHADSESIWRILHTPYAAI